MHHKPLSRLGTSAAGRIVLGLVVSSALLLSGCAGSSASRPDMETDESGNAGSTANSRTAVPSSACELLSADQIHALNPGLELSRDSENYCAFAAGPETRPTATLSLALVPNRPNYLASVRSALAPARQRDAITLLGSTGLCAQGTVGGGRTTTNLAMQVGDVGEGIVYEAPDPGIACSRVIAVSEGAFR